LTNPINSLPADRRCNAIDKGQLLPTIPQVQQQIADNAAQSDRHNYFYSSHSHRFDAGAVKISYNET